MNIDPETGLPELPEGYRWRVNSGREEGLLVCIEKPETDPFAAKVRNPDFRWWNEWFGTKERMIWSKGTRWVAIASAQTEAVTAESVLKAAKMVHADLTTKHERQQAAKSLIGVYPPKKLEASR